jgi:hypothetical protein
MRKLTVGAITVIVVALMLLSVMPMGTSDSTESSPRAGIKALVCYANSDDSGVPAYLQSDSRFSQVDRIDARYTTPSLTQLMQYDVVLTWTNYQYSNKVVLGNNLKTYVDFGGGVVVTCFAHHGSTWNLGGMFQSYGYDPIYQQNSYTSGSSSIGPVLQPSHPIMQGVTSVSPGFYFRTTLLNAGAQPLFYWANGYIGCAVKEIGPGRTVGMNQYPRTDGGAHSDLIIANAAAWAAGGTSAIPSEVDLEPQSLNLDSNGNWVSYKIYSFPDNPEYTVDDIDMTSVKVENVDANLKFGTLNNNKFIGKVDRLLVEDAIGSPGDDVEVEVSGQLNDGTAFQGKAIIKAILN